MNRKIVKLVELTTRQMVASMNSFVNAIHFPPNATGDLKLSEVKHIILLDWSL
jgi:hypothetical protein